MEINNKSIVLRGQSIQFGMSFAEVNKLLNTKQSPRADGSGHIIIQKEDCYGLKGNCALYFQKDVLCQISIKPDWAMYYFSDPKGNPILDADCTYHPDGYIPDWNFMEKYIKAIEKTVIADVVKWKNKVIEKTKEMVWIIQ